MRSFLLFVTCGLLAACSSEASNTGDTPAKDGRPAPSGDPGTDPGTEPGSPTTPSAVGPGAVDPTCGASGYMAVDGTLAALRADGNAGAIAIISGGLARVDAQGKIAKTAGSPVGDLVRAPDGRYYGVGGSGASVVRFAADLSIDTGFAFDEQFPGSIAGATVAPDGKLYLAGSVAVNTSQAHVVVRRFDASGKVDATFAPDDDEMPKDMTASGIALAKDGSVLVQSDDGFTPGILRLTTSGALDTSFGNGGHLVLSKLGPRYSREMLVDGEGRILVLGMTNDEVQVARLGADGAYDATFGSGGIAEVDLDELPSSSDVDENVEARAMFIDPQGRIVVVANYQSGKDTFKPDVQTLRVVRFDASGKLDASFGEKGIAKLDYGKDATASSALYRHGAVPLGDGRLVIGGQKRVGANLSYAMACVKM
jgi:uncharacterized delta-60 repeat protein